MKKNNKSININSNSNSEVFTSAQLSLDYRKMGESIRLSEGKRTTDGLRAYSYAEILSNFNIKP